MTTTTVTKGIKTEIKIMMIICFPIALMMLPWRFAWMMSGWILEALHED